MEMCVCVMVDTGDVKSVVRPELFLFNVTNRTVPVTPFALYNTQNFMS